MLKTKQNITLDNSNLTPAIYSYGDNNKPIVIMAHGIMGNKNEYLDTLARITEELDKLSIASLRIDFCGHGDSSKDLSDFSVSSQVEDLCDAVNWSIDQKYDQIILLGVSFGAPPSIIVSNLYKSYIAKCILIAPVIDYKKTFIYPLTEWGKTNFGYERILRGITDCGLVLDSSYILSSKVLLDMLLMDIPSFFTENKVETIIFHGNCDNMVPLVASKEVAQNNDNISIIIMDNTEHGITEVGDSHFDKSVSKNNLSNIIDEIKKGLGKR